MSTLYRDRLYNVSLCGNCVELIPLPLVELLRRTPAPVGLMACPFRSWNVSKMCPPEGKKKDPSGLLVLLPHRGGVIHFSLSQKINDLS